MRFTDTKRGLCAKSACDTDDGPIWKRAETDNAVSITKDEDFAQRWRGFEAARPELERHQLSDVHVVKMR